MTPTLFGRIQTRIFVTILIGGLWTLLVTPFLPGLGGDLIGDKYPATFTILGIMLGLGILWEFPYHLLQQFRWEKDWPALFHLLNIFNEGIVVYLVANSGRIANLEGGVPISTFLVHFVSAYAVTFAFVNGPMRVPFLRWRFRGGRLI